MLRAIALSISTALVLACVSVGEDFPEEPVSRLEVGRTTQAEIERTFGSPWRKGFENGQRTWTYGRYEYSFFAEPRARDLVVRFDEDGVLASYTYNATVEEP